MRTFVIFALTTGLALALVVFSVTAVACLTVGDPSFVASRIEASGFYEDFAENTLEVLSIDLEGTPDEVKEAIDRMRPSFERSLDPDLIRDNTQEILTGMERWLDGETELPEFVVDTKSIRADLGLVLASDIATRINSMPVCPAGTDYTNWDPFTAECRPPGPVDERLLLRQVDTFISQMPLLGREDVAGTDLVTAENEGKWRMVPHAYWWGKVALGLFAGLLVLACLVGVILSSKRASIMRRLGHASLFNALVLFIGGALSALFLGEHGLDAVGRDGTLEQAAFVEEVLVPLLRSFAQGVGAWLAIFGAVFAVLCVLCYLTAFWLRRRPILAPDTDIPATPPPPDQL